MNRDNYYEFLEALRRSGDTNMYGATQWLEGQEPEESSIHLEDYNLDPLAHDEAVAVLKDWMKNYNELSAKFGWDKEMTDIDEPEEITDNEEEYIRLFDKDIDRDLIDEFLKALSDQNITNELDSAKHIWYEDGLPFIIEYQNGGKNLISLVNGKVTVYDKFLDEYCDDFGLDFEEVRQKILDKTGIDFKPSFEDEFEDDSEEVVEYGSDQVIEDDFEGEE